VTKSGRLDALCRLVNNVERFVQGSDVHQASRGLKIEQYLISNSNSGTGMREFFIPESGIWDLGSRLSKHSVLSKFRNFFSDFFE
jgi:hypothetical protein